MATGPFKVLFVLLHVFETFLAKYVRAFGEYKMPMGIEMMADEVVICNMNNGTVEFVDFEGETTLTLPNPDGGQGPRQFDQPSVATVTLALPDGESS